MLFTVFFLSGLFHLAEDAGEGMKWQDSGSLRYYCMQPVGIMLEDGVQEIYRRKIKSKSKSNGTTTTTAGDDNNKRWARMVGYIWFVAWMTWTTPAWVYPKAVMAKGGQQDRILPFSLLGIIL